jgi:hypothetical protein
MLGMQSLRHPGTRDRYSGRSSGGSVPVDPEELPARGGVAAGVGLAGNEVRGQRLEVGRRAAKLLAHQPALTRERQSWGLLIKHGPR